MRVWPRVLGLGAQLLVLGLVSWVVMMLLDNIPSRNPFLPPEYDSMRREMTFWVINTWTIWLLGVIFWALRLPIREKWGRDTV